MILFSVLFPSGKPLKDLLVGSKNVLFATLGNNLLYDTLKGSVYDTPEIEVIYKTSLKASGETVSPDILVSQQSTLQGYSGKNYSGDTLTDYTIKYQIVSNNSAFILDTKTGNVTCTNNTTTSTRTFQIKATVTMTDSGISKDILITFTQAKGVRSQGYSEWSTIGINLSANYTSFSAASGSTLLTTQLVERRTLYTYWNDKLYDSSDEYNYTTVTPTYSDDSGWISISGSYASISANEKGSYRTGTITATYSGYTDYITISQDADYATGYSYSTYISGFSYSDSYAYSGSSSTPSGSYTQTYYRDYASGAWDVVSQETGTIGDSYCTFSGSSSYASLNSSTGKVTWNSANTSTSSNRSIYVTVTVNRNGQTETDGAYCYQRYDRSSTSTSREINFSASPNPISAAGGTVTLTCTGTTTTTTTWESEKPGSTTTSSFTPSISNTSQPSGFRRSGTTVTVDPNTGNSRSAKYTASYSGATSKTVTITQEADSTWTTTEYDYRCGISADDYTSSSSACPYSGGTTTLTYYAEYCTRTVTHYTSGKASSYGSWSGWKSASSSDYSITGGAQTGFNRSGNTVTIAKKTTSGQRSTTYKITYQDVSDTVTIYQDGYENVVITEYDCYINADSTSIDPNGGPITLDYYARYRTVTTNSSGASTYGDWTYVSNPSSYVSGSATGFSRSGTAVTVSSNTGTTSSRSCIYTITYQGTSDSVTITQEGDSVVTTTEYNYEYDCSLTTSKTYLNASGDTATLTIIARYRRQSRTKKTWEYAQTDAGSSAWSSWSSWNSASSSDYSINSGNTWCRRSGTTVTVSANASTSSRSYTFTLSYQGKTSSVTLTQVGKSLNKAFDLVINDNQAIGWTIGSSDQYEGMHVVDTPMPSFQYGGSATTYYENNLPLYVYRNWNDGILELYHRITSYPSSGQITVNVS